MTEKSDDGAGLQIALESWVLPVSQLKAAMPLVAPPRAPQKASTPDAAPSKSNATTS